MDILFRCPTHANELPFPAFAERVKAAGYDGVEMSLPNDDDAQKHSGKFSFAAHITERFLQARPQL